MSDETILVFSNTASAAETSPTRRGLPLRANELSAASTVAVNTLQENMRRFLGGLDSVMSASPKEVGGLALDEIEVHVQIDATGNVGIFGLGAELAAQGGITFVLRKRP